MNFAETIIKKRFDTMAARQICIAFLGDSVTNGCFELYPVDDHLATVYDEASAYHSVLKKLFAVVYPDVPFVMINAGISGDTIEGGLSRLDRDVLSYHPDIVVVSFGLNHYMDDEKGLASFENSLREIIERTKKSGADVIVMTPNMIADRVAGTVREPMMLSVAERICTPENSDNVGRHIESMRRIAKEMSVPLCDCYAVWEKMKASGADLPDLLSNKINHPRRELHGIFAYELFKTIIGA